jgi:hypothetical protein
MLKTFASAGSLNAEVECQENHISSGFSTSNDFRRLKLTQIHLIDFILK